MKKAFVVVISGVTAGGKSTLIDQLHKEIPDSKVLSFDDYDIDQLPSAPRIDEPIAGAVNQYDISKLMEEFLKAYRTSPILFVDFPFGERHKVLTPYIDLSIYVKTPLDIVFARQIVRDYSDKTTEDIVGWAKRYIDFARPIFIDFEDYISDNTDYVLDGSLSLDEKVQKVKEMINLSKKFKGVQK